MAETKDFSCGDNKTNLRELFSDVELSLVSRYQGFMVLVDVRKVEIVGFSSRCLLETDLGEASLPTQNWSGEGLWTDLIFIC